MVTIEIDLKDGDKEPEQQLDDGEHIERRIVPLNELYDTLQGMFRSKISLLEPTKLLALSKENDKVVDARLYHWALGLHWSQRLLS